MIWVAENITQIVFQRHSIFCEKYLTKDSTDQSKRDESVISYCLSLRFKCIWDLWIIQNLVCCCKKKIRCLLYSLLLKNTYRWVRHTLSGAEIQRMFGLKIIPWGIIEDLTVGEERHIDTSDKLLWDLWQRGKAAIQNRKVNVNVVLKLHLERWIVDVFTWVRGEKAGQAEWSSVDQSQRS